jgi:hypothetical protein
MEPIIHSTIEFMVTLEANWFPVNASFPTAGGAFTSKIKGI